MASTIKLKNGSGAPTTGDLVQGEPALDLTNKRLYTENASGVVIEVGTNPSTIDINAGTIDGTVIGGSSAAAGSFTTISASGEIAANGGIALGDNDKATFGAGDDLQIYHDGSNSYIDDTGTGNLFVRASDNFYVQNAAGTETKAAFTTDGAVKLYYNGGTKFQTVSGGIDVTGTVTADGLTVSNTGTGSTINVERTDGSAFSLSAGSYSILGTDDATNLYFKTNGAFRQLINSNGDISFYEDTGTTPKFFWDASAESLGIGTVSPEKALHVNSGTSNIGVRVESSDATASIEFMDSGTTSTGTSARVGGISDDFFVQTNGSERMRIDSSGNLLVGKTSTGVSGVGVEARNDGFLVATRSSNTVAGFNRTTDDGEIVRFYKDTSTVGSIRSQSGLVTDIILDPRLNNYATGHGFGGTQVSGVPKIIPRDGSGNALDGGIDLGHSNSRFKGLYLSGGVYLGGTGAANHLDDYEEGTWTPTIVGTSTAGSHTYTTQTGYYVKIGDFVHLQFKVALSAKGGMAGVICIGGVPFTGGSISSDTSVNFVKYSNLSATVDQVYLLERPGAFGQYYISLFTFDGAGSTTSTIAANGDITNTTEFEGTISFRVG